MPNGPTRRRLGQTVCSLSVAAGFLADHPAGALAGGRPGDRVPLPHGETVLARSGASATKNPGAVPRRARGSRGPFGLVQYTVVDARRDRSATVAGVRLTDRVTSARAAGTATALHLVALDDPQADRTLTDVRPWRGLPAARAVGGPTRVVFPDHHAAPRIHALPQIDTRAAPPRWGRRLRTIDGG